MFFYQAFIPCNYYILEDTKFPLSLKQHNEHYIMGFSSIIFYEYI